MSCIHTSKPGGPCSQCLMPVVARVVAEPVDLNNLASLLRRSRDHEKAALGGRACAAKRRARAPQASRAPRSMSAQHRERVSEAMSKVWAERTGISTAERATKIKALRTQGLTYRDIARQVPCGHRTVQRVLKEM